jgi:hypothetical protein
MAGVKLRGITSVITAPSQSSVHTMYRLTAAANHGILIYRVQVDLDPNGRSASKVAQVTINKPTAGSEAYNADKDPIKVRDDDETVQTDGDEKATTEPTAGVTLDSRQVSIGGTGITTVVFSYPRGMKIDGGELFSVALTEPNSPSAYAKYQVTVDLEE